MQMMICGNRNGMWQHLKLLTSICRQVFPVASNCDDCGIGFYTAFEALCNTFYTSQTLLFDRRLDLAIAFSTHLGGFVNRTASGRSYLLRPLLLPTDLPTSPAIMTVAVVLLRSLARGWVTWMWCTAGYNGGGGLVASAAMVYDGVLPCWWSGGYGGVPVVYCRPEARGRRAGGGALSIWPNASLSRLWSLSPSPVSTVLLAAEMENNLAARFDLADLIFWLRPPNKYSHRRNSPAGGIHERRASVSDPNGGILFDVLVPYPDVPSAGVFRGEEAQLEKRIGGD
nr:hypothetical protein Iba_chr09bCG7000 [Ipomoea batatas]